MSQSPTEAPEVQVRHAKILALIPARGGSKGVPRKNLRSLAGKQLLVHTVEQALAAQRVDRVVVSTDDAEIADTARSAGAEVIDRPADLSGDTASSESALSHALEVLAAEGYAPDLLVFLQATSPLRRPGAIDAAIETLERQQADSLFSACPVHGFVWRQQEDEVPRSLTYDFQHRPRRQDIGEDWLENGSIYVFKPEILRRDGNRLGGQVAIYPMDPLDSFQVDEPGDLELMERLLTVRSESAASAPAPIPAPAPALARLAAIHLLVFDFDGVLTDDRVLVDQDGREAVFCHRGDGLGLERLRRDAEQSDAEQHGSLELRVLSRETNPVVAARCRKLGLACEQSCTRKLEALQQLATERGLDAAQVAFMGNDVNDLDALRWAGLAIAPADARPEILATADWVTGKPGGRGAVREVCDHLLAARQEPTT